MKEVAVALAIELEEHFRGTVCYFGRAPHPKAKKPDQIIVIHAPKHGEFILEGFVQSKQAGVENYVTDVYKFVCTKDLLINGCRHGSIKRMGFSGVEEVALISDIEGYNGFAFSVRPQPIGR